MLGNGDFFFTNIISGTGGFVWDMFDNEMIFEAANIYTGPTVIGSGLTLALAGNGSMSQSSLSSSVAIRPTMFRWMPVPVPMVHLTLAGGQTLGGIGTINGKLIVQPGATIAPGGTN